MANSTSHLDLVSASQSSKEVTVNAALDAASPSMLYGRRASTTSALTFGYYGGNLMIGTTPTAIANGTVTLTASTTNYIEADPATGAVSVNTVGFTSGAIQLYEIVTGTATVTSYTDKRTGGAGNSGGGGSGDVTGPASSVGDNFATFNGASGKVIKDSGIALDTDTSLTANSDTKIASQKAVKAYVDSIVTGGAADLMVFKGVLDCSANPNYPAANAGDLYKVSVAGKIGGASGLDVLAGDTLYCITDSSASGTHASVGANWNVANENVTTGTHGALIAGATAKTTPVDADMLGLMDSAASNILKKLSWANLKATLKTYFDTLYAPASQPYDVFSFYPGVPTNSAKMFRSKIPRAVTFAANFSGSYFTATANATGSSVFDIQKNGSSIGSCTIASGGTTPTFTSSGGLSVSFAAGDVLEIICPSSADATLANPSITLVGAR